MANISCIIVIVFIAHLFRLVGWLAVGYRERCALNTMHNAHLLIAQSIIHSRSRFGSRFRSLWCTAHTEHLFDLSAFDKTNKLASFTQHHCVHLYYLDYCHRIHRHRNRHIYKHKHQCVHNEEWNSLIERESVIERETFMITTTIALWKRMPTIQPQFSCIVDPNDDRYTWWIYTNKSQTINNIVSSGDIAAFQ